MIPCKHRAKLNITHFYWSSGYRVGILSGRPVRCCQCEKYLRLEQRARSVGRAIPILMVAIAIPGIYFFFSESVRRMVSELSAIHQIIIPYALGYGWLIPYFTYKAIIARHGPWEEIEYPGPKTPGETAEGYSLQESSKTETDSTLAN